jgi:hypothetical protein
VDERVAGVGHGRDRRHRAGPSLACMPVPFMAQTLERDKKAEVDEDRGVPAKVGGGEVMLDFGRSPQPLLTGSMGARQGRSQTQLPGRSR